MTQQLLDKIASLKDALRQEQERRIDAERRLDGVPDRSQPERVRKAEQEVQRLQGEVARIKAEYARKFGELQRQAERGETKSAEIAQYKRGLTRVPRR